MWDEHVTQSFNNVAGKVRGPQARLPHRDQGPPHCRLRFAFTVATAAESATVLGPLRPVTGWARALTPAATPRWGRGDECDLGWLGQENGGARASFPVTLLSPRVSHRNGRCERIVCARGRRIIIKTMTIGEGCYQELRELDTSKVNSS